jgi:hypothetical protein
VTGKRLRHLTIAASAVAIVLLAVLAVLIAVSQHQQRSEIEKRFRDRPTVTAALTNAIFQLSETSTRQNASKTFGTKVVSAKALERYAGQGQIVYAKVVGPDGKVLAATASTPKEALAKPIPDVAKSAVAAGKPMFSSVIQGPAPGSRVVEGAVPFTTRHGQRVLVTATSAELISRFLAGFLAGLPNPGKTNSVIIDQQGIVVASPDKGVKAGERYKDTALLSALRDAPYGPYKLDGVNRHFASKPVITSPWKVVIARDDDVLYSTVNGSRTTLPWVIFGFLVLAAAAGVLLLRRVATTTAEIERREINQQHAVEINDNILQRIALAYYAMENGNEDLTREKLSESLREAQRLVNRLLGRETVEPGSLRRRERASTSDRS